ncbi:hypothetical protein ACFQ7N_10625 [Streptomyces niveus]|uniref:hypothetical protein n=1 Tax=Streptomyces niveus TaxID=193462 RepID=UPI00368DB0C4
MSQRQVAWLADRMDPASYGKFERDELREVTDEQIDAIARALQMDTTDRDILFVLAKGKYPPMRPGDSRDPNNHLREFVEEMDAWERPGKKGIILGPLAFTTDPFYYVTACNEGFASLFEKGDLPANVLTWGLLGGDGRLLKHDHYLLSAARVRVAVLERTYGDDPRFRVIDELLKSLPPSDTLSDHLTKGLQEDIFPYWPLGYAAGSMRSSEMHIAGVGGLTDWSRLFIMDFWENVEPDELRAMSSSDRKSVSRKRIHRLPG